jgi:aldose 1-epimerase
MNLKKNWQSAVIANGVKFSYFSSDGECGFPGEVCIECTYFLESQENKIIIEYKAVSDKPTPVNLTNHAYFNLNGHNSGEKVYNHDVKFNADNLLEIDAESVCTGRLLKVENSKYDFRNFAQLGERIRPNGKWPEDGFDNFFITNNNSEFKQVAW